MTNPHNVGDHYLAPVVLRLDAELVDNDLTIDISDVMRNHLAGGMA